MAQTASYPSSALNVQRQDLRRAGLKVTSPRLKILEVLETS